MSGFSVFDQWFSFDGQPNQAFLVYHPLFRPDGRKYFYRGYTVAESGIECWDSAASMIKKVEKAFAKAEYAPRPVATCFIAAALTG